MIKKATKIALQKQYIKTEVITLKTNYEEKEKKKNRKREIKENGRKGKRKEENKRILELLSFMGGKYIFAHFFKSEHLLSVFFFSIFLISLSICHSSVGMCMHETISVHLFYIVISL